jgi:hypothetical protein
MKWAFLSYIKQKGKLFRCDRSCSFKVNTVLGNKHWSKNLYFSILVFWFLLILDSHPHTHTFRCFLFELVCYLNYMFQPSKGISFMYVYETVALIHLYVYFSLLSHCLSLLAIRLLKILWVRFSMLFLVLLKQIKSSAQLDEHVLSCVSCNVLLSNSWW